MCGRYALSVEAAEIAEWFDAGEVPALKARYNIAPSQDALIIRVSGQTGRRVGRMARWGLIPSWARDESIGAKTINARAETAAEKPMYRKAFQSRRCAVPASGFYEWQAVPGSKTKQPMFIHGRDSRPIAFAGLWERWRPEGAEAIETFTILTCDANALMMPIHSRMPVMLERDDLRAWLDEKTERSALEGLMLPRDWPGMEAYAVSTLVNSPRNEEKECAARAGDGGGTLFSG